MSATLYRTYVIVLFWGRNFGYRWELSQILRNFSGEIAKDGCLSSIQTNTEITSSQLKQLNRVVDKYFELMGDKLGCTTVIKHKIVTTSDPIKQRYYPVSPHVQKCIDEELQILDLGVIEKTNSGWSSPVIMVPKKDGSYRFCIDYRKLNAVTLHYNYFG